MNENEYKELINKKIDGEISNDEEAQLKQVLSKNPQANSYNQDMHKMVRIISETEQVQPPENLKKHVMESIDLNRYTSRPDNIIKPGHSWWVVQKTGLAFAAGLLLGIVLYALFLPGTSFISGPDESDMYGTIGLKNTGAFQTISETPLNTEGANGMLALKKSGSFFMLDVNINASEKAEILIRFNENDARFTGFNEKNNTAAFVESGSDYIRLTVTESTHFNLYLDKIIANTSATIMFQLQAESGILNKEIQLTD